jgi:hypothetical protein
MEQVIDWLNENEVRAYPLLDSADRRVIIGPTADITYLIPDNLLLDLQLKLVDSSLTDTDILFSGLCYKRYPEGSSSDLNLDTVEVYISEYQYGQGVRDLVIFSIPQARTRSYPTYIRTPEGHLGVFGKGVKEYADIMYPRELNGCSRLGAGAGISIGIPIEPSACIQFNDAWLGVNSLRTAPEKKTVDNSYTPVLPLVSVYDPLQQQTGINEPTKLDGDVQLLEGFNFRVNINNELIDLEVGAAYGLMMNCETRFLDPIYLNCDELVSYINGIPPDDRGNFRLLPGNSIIISSGETIDSTFEDSLTEPSNPNTLFVGLDFQKTDICAPVNLTPAI